MLSLLSYPFIQHAFIAGTLVAIVAACVGYFLLIRGLTFAGHALSHIGFAGAAGALVAHIDPIFGMLFSTVTASMIIGFFGKRLRERDISIGIIMTLMLGLGALFISLYSGYAERAYSILFGTVLGISNGDVLITAIFCFISLSLLLFIFRPLLFSSVDSRVAQAKGVPVRGLGILFLCLTAITVSMSVQVVGVLLIFTLLIGPAATAIQIAHRPFVAIMVAVLLGVLYTWIGIFLAININFPVSFFIATLSFSVYICIRIFFRSNQIKKLGVI